MSYTQPYTVKPGAVPAPVQVASATPAGFTLINRGDNGGTVLVAAGPNGTTVPLTAGGSVDWVDATTYPYLSLPAGATAAETVVVTDQAQNYTNPVAVATATATQLAAKGVPNVFQSTVLFDADVNPSAPLSSITVGGYASVLIKAQWKPDNSGNYGPGALQLGNVGTWLGMDASVDTAAPGATWEMPVAFASFTAYNPLNPGGMPCHLTVTGTNRPVARARMVGLDTAGAKLLGLQAAATAAGQYLPMIATLGTGANASGLFGGSNSSRMAGPIKLHWNTNVSGGYLMCQYVDWNATVVTLRWPLSGTDGVIDWIHPVLPVHWIYYSAGAGASINMAVLAANP